MKQIFTSAVLTLCSILLVAQSTQWNYQGKAVSGSPDWSSNTLEPLEYGKWKISYQELKTSLWSDCVDKGKKTVIMLPGPDGYTAPFKVEYAPVAHPILQEKFPEIRTFMAHSMLDHELKAHLTLSPSGLKAIIDGGKEIYYITPSSEHNANEHGVFLHRQYPTTQDGQPILTCEAEGLDVKMNEFARSHGRSNKNFSCEDLPQLKYRLAMACTGEFARRYGGTVTGAMTEIMDIVNKVNFAFVRDAGIFMELVPNNENVIYLNSGTDPYTNGNTGAMLSENPGVLDQFIGTNNYDIGHVVGTNAGGLASLSSVCNPGSKAQGVSCQFGNYSSTLFFIIVAHEMGHQFSATHTFNFCDGNESPGTAYEPGSGNTIMGYSGAGCANQNQRTNDPFFHVASIQQIQTFSRDRGGLNCAELVPTDNDCPIIELPYENGFYIPKKTPFELTGFATDPNGDQMTYTWEQYNLGPPIPVGAAPFGGAPGFKFNPPDTNNTRVFPNINLIRRQDFNDLLEYLPDSCQDLDFRFTARDNHDTAGAAVWEQVSFQVACDAGPFRVLQPGNTPDDELYGGFKNVIRWNPAESQASPVDCKFVDIMLSIDDGFTYPDTIAKSISNDGSALVFIPEEYMGERNVRLKIKCSDNVFFHISPDDLLVTEPNAPGYQADVEPTFQDICLPDNASFQINTESYLDYDSTLFIDYRLSFTEGVSFNLRSDTIVPGDDLSFDVSFSDFPPEDTLVVDFQFYRGSDTIKFTSIVRVTSNNFDDLTLLGPNDGEAAVDLLPDFNWTKANNADEYLVQISTTASFDPGLVIYEELTRDTSLEAPITLEPSSVYFWRVVPLNRCGFEENVPIYAFASKTFDCETYEYNGTEVRLPGNRPATTVIDLPILQDGIIDDINVDGVRLNHESMGQLSGILRSPAETEVLLWANQCESLGEINAFFDDDAATDFDCLEFGQGLRPLKPEEPLSAFHGEDIRGNWELVIEDELFGSGGNFVGFDLEICVETTEANPVRINNDTLFLTPNTEKVITENELLYENDNILSNFILFQVISPVTKGELRTPDRIIDQGKAFRLSTLLNGELTYRHLSDEEEYDQFTFVVYSLFGGWAGMQDTFHIRTDRSINNEELPKHQALNIYPNPNGLGQAFVDLPLEFDQQPMIKLFSADGRNFAVPTTRSNNQMVLDIKNLENGLYFVEIRSGSDWYISKLIVSR